MELFWSALILASGYGIQASHKFGTWTEAHAFCSVSVRVAIAAVFITMFLGLWSFSALLSTYYVGVLLAILTVTIPREIGDGD